MPYRSIKRLVPLKENLKKIFQEILFFFSWGYKQARLRNRYLALFELLPNKLLRPYLEPLNNHIILYILIGYQIGVKGLKAEIPNDCIGILTVYYGKKLEYREYLQKRLILVERTSLSSRRILSSNLPALRQFASSWKHNKLHS